MTNTNDTKYLLTAKADSGSGSLTSAEADLYRQITDGELPWSLARPSDGPGRSTRYSETNPTSADSSQPVLSIKHRTNPTEFVSRPRVSSSEKYWQKRAQTARGQWSIHQQLRRTLEALAESGMYDRERHANRWLPLMDNCPGVLVECEAVHPDTDRSCGELHIEYHLCRHPLCPFYAASVSRNLTEAIRYIEKLELIEAGKFYTFSPPNLRLSREAVRDLRKVLGDLRRRKVMSGVRGAIERLEIEMGDDTDNLHSHVYADADYIAHYPMSDLAYENSNRRAYRATTAGNLTKDAERTVYQVESYRQARRNDSSRPQLARSREHMGLAREFTLVCQKYDSLKASCGTSSGARVGCDHSSGDCQTFDIDNPNHWYFVDLRSAENAAAEIAKYITKQAKVVADEDPAKVWRYIDSIKGTRMISIWGEFYKRFRIDGKTGLCELVKVCDADRGGRICNFKNHIREFNCGKCGADLLLTELEADALARDEQLEIDAAEAAAAGLDPVLSDPAVSLPSTPGLCSNSEWSHAPVHKRIGVGPAVVVLGDDRARAVRDPVSGLMVVQK